MVYDFIYTKFLSVLEGYNDYSWITSARDNNATFGWVFTLGNRAVSLASKIQKCISHFTIETEFIDLVAYGKNTKCLMCMVF